MPIAIQVRDDPRKIALLERIALAVENIAAALKQESIDPAEVAAQTARLAESSGALGAAIEEHPAPAP